MSEVLREFVLLSRRVVTPEGVRAAAVHISNGRIAALHAPGSLPAGIPAIDVGDNALLPGLVDIHVHVNQPGRTEWEGFETATRAAAAGGVTTLVDMPLNSAPVTTDTAALAAKRAAASAICTVDVGFHGGVIPGNLAEIEPLIDSGVLGIKAFLVHSGIDEFPNVSLENLRVVAPLLARRGVPLLVHAEWDAPMPGEPILPASPSPLRRYADYAATRPAAWELRAIAFLLDICRESGVALHIVHLAAAEALPLLAAARAEGLPVTVETAPHYLFFDSETIPDADPRYKCAPPIRDAASRDGLWEGLRAGTIDCIATDHSPCPPALKRLESGDLAAAWGGIASLQSGLSAVWTGASRRDFSLEDVARWMGAAPARAAGLAGRKGVVAPGADADLVVFDPDAVSTLAAADLHYRHSISPYVGQSLRGRVLRTYLRGALIFDEGAFPHDEEPLGRLIRREGPA